MQPEYLSYALWSLATLLTALGFVGCILPIPGHLFILMGGCLVAYDKELGWWVYLTLSLLALIGMLIDNIFTYYGGKRFGSSKHGLWGSIIGLFIGTIFFPLGLIIGPFAGAFIAEYIVVKRSIKESSTSGLGALLGFIAGTLAKLLLGGVMCLVVLLQ